MNANNGKPLWEDWITFRYKPKSERYRECAPCKSFGLFDWVIWLPDSKRHTRIRGRKPGSVLCLPTLKSIRVLKKRVAKLSQATVVFAGEDTNLSKVREEVDAIASHCRKVYFEAKDVPHDHVRSLSMGFNPYYLRDCGETSIESAIAEVDAGMEKSGVLAAWGGQWPKLDDAMPERRRACEFAEHSPLVNYRKVEFEAYWPVLARHQFLMAPIGKGIQAPKLAEAWMVKTIPIVLRTPCFEDLVDAGYPLVILEDWGELSAASLDAWAMEHANTDWERVRHMLTLPHLETLLGQNHNPESASE